LRSEVAMGLFDKKKEKPRADFGNVESGGSSTAPRATPAAGTTRTYVVRSGDSLSKIAKEHYGRAEDWRKIYEANRDLIKDPDLIYPGQELKLPA
jgi:nucleoid-associated protein YgaU